MFYTFDCNCTFAHTEKYLQYDIEKKKVTSIERAEGKWRKGELNISKKIFLTHVAIAPSISTILYVTSSRSIIYRGF